MTVKSEAIDLFSGHIEIVLPFYEDPFSVKVASVVLKEMKVLPEMKQGGSDM